MRLRTQTENAYGVKFQYVDIPTYVNPYPADTNADRLSIRNSNISRRWF